MRGRATGEGSSALGTSHSCLTHSAQVGFLVVLSAPAGGGATRAPWLTQPPVCEIVAALGAALFVLSETVLSSASCERGDFQRAGASSAVPTLLSPSDSVYSEAEGEDATSPNTVAEEEEALARLLRTASADADTLLSWDTDFTTVPGAEAQRLVVAMAHGSGLLLGANVRVAAFARFVASAARRYRRTDGFHTFGHAAGVAHVAWRFATSPELRVIVSPADGFALLAAAVVHDVGHTGVTNAFHISTSSPLGARPRTAVPDDALPSAAIQRRQSARERSVRVSDFQMAAAHSSDLFRLLPAPQWVGGSSSRRAWPHSGTTPPERWRASSSCQPSGPPTVRAHPDLWGGKP